MIELRVLRDIWTEEGARTVFAQIVTQCVKSKYPSVREIRPNPGDEGIDSFVGEFDGDIRVYQSKYFCDGVGGSQKNNIRESFKTCIESKYLNNVVCWTLCIPIELDVKEEKWWQKWKASKSLEYGCQIELWSKTSFVSFRANPNISPIFDVALKLATSKTDQLPTKLHADELMNRYMRVILKSCKEQDFSSIGRNTNRANGLSKVLPNLYIPIKVHKIENHADLDEKNLRIDSRLKGYEYNKFQNSRIDVWKKIKENCRLLILGGPGIGKTTLLKQITNFYLLKYLKKEDRIRGTESFPDIDWFPLLIRCRDLDTSLKKISWGNIVSNCLERYELSKDEARELFLQIKQGKLLLLVDGLDEIESSSFRQRIAKRINQVNTTFSDVAVIITSRVTTYAEFGHNIGEDYECLLVSDLILPEKIDFIKQWDLIAPLRKEPKDQELTSHFEKNKSLDRITHTPMLLIAAIFLYIGGKEFPVKKRDLYFSIVDTMFNWKPEVYEIIDWDDAAPRFEVIAYYLSFSGRKQFTLVEIFKSLFNPSSIYSLSIGENVSLPSLKKFIKIIDDQSSLIICRGHNKSVSGKSVPEYEFNHPSIQDYFSALYLAEDLFFSANNVNDSFGNVRKIFYSKEAKGKDTLNFLNRWTEVIPIVVSMADDRNGADPIISFLLEKANEAETAGSKALIGIILLSIASTEDVDWDGENQTKSQSIFDPVFVSLF